MARFRSIRLIRIFVDLNIGVKFRYEPGFTHLNQALIDCIVSYSTKSFMLLGIQIGGYYVADDGSQKTFSQYVMPYKNPNPGARRSFGIKVVSIGRYRMLKDVETGTILKTKSEISALLVSVVLLP